MLEFPALLLLGFVVGLSGAVIPGPLLAFVIFDTARKRKVTGHFIIAGHALWEALIIFLILFGFGSVMLQYRIFIYVIGGVVLVLMGVLMVRSKDDIKTEGSKVNSSLLGWIFYTAFNPAQPPCCASAGLALLLQGYELVGNVGIITVTAGHWLADLTYYALISYIVYKSGRFFIPRR
ncbi:MAG: LysE family transporter, partial [Candidatus Bathyarchaeia archaeon]